MQSNMFRLLAIASFSQCISAITPANPPAVQGASINNGGLNVEGVETFDGMALNAIPEGKSALAKDSPQIPKQAWTVTADSYQPGYPPYNVLDNNNNTFWHTPWDPNTGAGSTPQPHWITVDMQAVYYVNSLTYEPRQDNWYNGNIGEHDITLSTDGVNFGTPKAYGTYRDDNSPKTTIFEATLARYVKFTATTEAGDRGTWASVAELTIYTNATAPSPYGGLYGGEWSPTIDFPLVPVSAALEHDTGKVIVWSSYTASTFGGGNGGNTLTATFDPATQIVSQRNISNTDHDMFCEGLSMDSTGRIIAAGGNNAPKTSLYSPKYDSWTAEAQMNIPRGYQSQATLSDGRAFTIGGSWSGGQGGKNGEIYDPFVNTWTLLPGAPVAPMLTNDGQGIYRADNHGWLFGWKNGYVFQAGPSSAMNWYGTQGDGSQAGAGTRADDPDSMCGDAVMFDAVAGQILTVGGATSYQGVDSTTAAHIITIGDPNTNPTVQTISGMYNQRIFANAVVLPSGEVFITGGQVYGQPFSDETAQLQPELWDPVTLNFLRLPPMSIPRNYHSIAILLQDGTVLSGGGGLCGPCATNHYDGQVFSPPYLFNDDGSRATRPVITDVNEQCPVGGTLTATTDSDISSWSMVRIGSTTHTVNTDQRRVPLTATANGNTYTMQTPNDPGVTLPGFYLLFAMNAQGVPSMGKFIWVPAPGQG